MTTVREGRFNIYLRRGRNVIERVNGKLKEMFLFAEDSKLKIKYIVKKLFFIDL